MAEAYLGQFHGQKTTVPLVSQATPSELLDYSLF